jgi:predicted amidophosphoribosyltransferase
MLERMLSKLLGLVVPPLCVECGADAGRAAPLCRECRGVMRPLACTSPWAAFAYEGPAGAMVRALKFGGRSAVADAMAAQMFALAPPGLLVGEVVPVPVHPAHARRRGIDHAAALARALARRSGLPFADCLVRRGDPRPQVGRGRQARIRGPVGKMDIRPGAPVPRIALLVDDVITTGATLAACSTTLRVAGCQEIAPIAYARTTAR